MDKVAPPWSEERPVDLLEQEVMDNLDSDTKRKNERPFDKVEFNRALLKCRNNSSPGRDGIEYKMIKNLPEYLKDSLLDCMNEAFIKGYVIQDWKNLQTIFIS